MRRFVELCAAEWTKATRKPLHRLLLGLLVSIGLLFTLLALGRYWVRPGEREWLERMLAWPNALRVASNSLSVFARFAAVLLAASVVGGEYGGDTWKALLPRRASRAPFLLAKLAVVALLLPFAMATFVASYAIPSKLATLALGLVPSGDPVHVGQTFAQMALFFPVALFFAAVAMLGAVATRSTLGGSIVGIAAMLLLDAVGDADPLMAMLLPSVHFQNLAALASGNAELLDHAQMAFEAEVSLPASALVVLGYLAALVGAALALFRGRDHAGAS